MASPAPLRPLSPQSRQRRLYKPTRRLLFSAPDRKPRHPAPDGLRLHFGVASKEKWETESSSALPCPAPHRTMPLGSGREEFQGKPTAATRLQTDGSGLAGKRPRLSQYKPRPVLCQTPKGKPAVFLAGVSAEWAKSSTSEP